MKKPSKEPARWAVYVIRKKSERLGTVEGTTGGMRMWKVMRVQVSFALGLATVAAQPAWAGCGTLSLCGKTILVTYQLRAASQHGSSSYTGRKKLYFPKDGNILLTGTSENVTDRARSGFLGTVCSEAGSTTSEVCPGKLCSMKMSNRSVGYRLVERRSCKAAFLEGTFVLHTDSTTEVSGTVPSVQTVTGVEQYVVGKNNCSVQGSDTTRVVGRSSSFTIESALSSISCQIVDGRRL